MGKKGGAIMGKSGCDLTHTTCKLPSRCSSLYTGEIMSDRRQEESDEVRSQCEQGVWSGGQRAGRTGDGKQQLTKQIYWQTESGKNRRQKSRTVQSTSRPTPRLIKYEWNQRYRQEVNEINTRATDLFISLLILWISSF